MIKKFERQYLTEVMNIWLDTNISAHPFIDKSNWENTYELVEKMLPYSDIFIFYEEGLIKGFIGISDNVYIAGLFVSTRYQSQGIGKMLLDHCKNYYPTLELDVFLKNEKAINFYKKTDLYQFKRK